MEFLEQMPAVVSALAAAERVTTHMQYTYMYKVGKAWHAHDGTCNALQCCCNDTPPLVFIALVTPW